MTIHPVMRAVAAGLLGCAAGAAGQEIPVHREYTRPIVFTDDQGGTWMFAADAAGLDAQRALKNAQAQAALLGKETLFDITFGKSGAALLAPARAAPVSLPGPAERPRREDGDADRNWLSQSLALPGLGQTSTNAAAAAISAGDDESDWGWLADAVSGRGPDVNRGADELLKEEDQDLSESAAALQDMAKTFSGRDGESTRPEREPVSAEPLTAAAFPDPANQTPATTPEAAAWGGGPAAGRAWGGRRESEPATVQDGWSVPAAASMDQTRKVLDELSAGFRPDFAAMRNSLLGGGSAPAWGGNPVQPAAATAGTGLAWPGGASSARLGPDMAPAGRNSSAWQGGWTGQNAGMGLSGGFGGAAVPVTPPAVSSDRRGSPRPDISSGGTKPGWY